MTLQDFLIFFFLILYVRIVFILERSCNCYLPVTHPMNLSFAF